MGRIRGWQRRWRGLRKIEQVELQSMVMWHTVPWIFLVSWCAGPVGLNLRHETTAQLLGWSMIVVAVLQCVQFNRTLRRALDHYLGRAPFPRRDLAVMLGLTAAGFGLALALQHVDGVKGDVLGLGVLFLITPYAEALGFALSIRSFFRHLAGILVVLLAAFAAVGTRGGMLAALAMLIAVGGLVSLLTSRCGAWTLSVMWEAERARETESRLAVAEERLRFGRDLHDVMGRNLAVIALKSELAVQLARRGRPEAVEQMIEVQRIAQESQREIREVVRGYRDIDLGVELVGARGVLEAAGIACRVTGSPAGLPDAVQSALAWVVREGTTNVLRHGDARRCAIELSAGEGRTTLTIENDGVPDVAAAPAGSGLAGLGERLAGVGGTLEHDSADGSFRLTARVPLPEPDTGPDARSALPGARAL
ncbi:sensor histidine kinase [Streptomyces lasiicapitis]|uniref:sensor histidine kinase n=1 Tax=Streptomyces lasiicapitis TaxID=1923961 RepID=UPI00331DC6F0